MEDGGGNGSVGAHFEKLVFGDDTMVSDDTTDAKYGQMSLAVGKDSGWYEVDMGMGEHYFWGKNEGCSIFENTCSTANVTEFCSEQYASECSDNHIYRTSCSNSQFTGSCNINLNIKSCKKHHTPSQNLYHFGNDAMCLNTKVIFFNFRQLQEVWIHLQVVLKLNVIQIKLHIKYILIQELHLW